MAGSTTSKTSDVDSLAQAIYVANNHSADAWDSEPAQYIFLGMARAAIKATDALAREKIAMWMIAHSFATGHGDTIDDLLGELAHQTRDHCDQLAAVRRVLDELDAPSAPTLADRIMRMALEDPEA